MVVPWLPVGPVGFSLEVEKGPNRIISPLREGKKPTMLLGYPIPTDAYLLQHQADVYALLAIAGWGVAVLTWMVCIQPIRE